MTVLVVEGGGMRATYAAGVLASLQAEGFEPEAIYGTSAGASLAAWYAAGQAEAGVRTFDAATDRRTLSYRRFLLGRGPILDLDDLYGRVYVREVPLDVDAVKRAPFPVFASATDVGTGCARYLDLRRVDVLRALRAASALPLVVAGEVVLDGVRLLDGGVVDPVPVRRAVEDGATDVLLVLNRPASERRTPEPFPIAYAVGRRYPALLHAAFRHHALWNEAVAFAKAPPAGVRVRIVAPRVPLGVGRLTREPPKLAHAIAVGRVDGREAAAALGLGAHVEPALLLDSAGLGDARSAG